MSCPLSRCDVKRVGRDVTVVASGYMVWHAMLAAQILEPEGIDVEVVDVRTVSPLDEDTIGESAAQDRARGGGRRGVRQYGPANEWAMVAIERAWDRSRHRSSGSPGATRRSRSPTASRTASGRAPRTSSRGHPPAGRPRLKRTPKHPTPEEVPRMATEVFIPKMTDFMEEAVIVSWLVAEGDHVDEGQPLLELETDKATVEMESPATGYLVGIRPDIIAGATIPVGTTIAYIAESPDERVEELPAM